MKRALFKPVLTVDSKEIIIKSDMALIGMNTKELVCYQNKLRPEVQADRMRYLTISYLSTKLN